MDGRGAQVESSWFPRIPSASRIEIARVRITNAGLRALGKIRNQDAST
jgi:hypothetical protein